MPDSGGSPVVGAAAEARPKVLIIGPLPPPEFGVARATKLMLESPILATHLRIVHLDTSDVLGFHKMGKLDWRNTYLGLKHVAQLLSLLRRERPQVALLTVSQGRFALIRDAIFAALSRAFGAATVAYLRGSGYADMRARQGQIAARVLASILKHSSRVIVLGESLVDMAHTACPGCRVAVVPNGCSPAVQESQVGVRDERHPVLVYIGRLSRKKGLEDALGAVRDIAGSVPTLEFVLCGEWDSPAYRAEVEPLVKEHGLLNIVRFPGPTSGHDKETLLARAWVLIVPSHSEGQPWVILEAMSAGIPVVATDTGAIAETVQDGITGFVIPVADSDALAKRVATILQDDELWKRMSRESVRRYQERFTVEQSHSALAKELCRVARED